MVKLFSKPILLRSVEEYRLALDQLRGMNNAVSSGSFRCGSQESKQHSHLAMTSRTTLKGMRAPIMNKRAAVSMKETLMAPWP